ncbi:murein biosynthesis integral membrane protein MurJ [Bacillus sp. FJAT-29790]|uniref:murein biosynthesis integral membrane protein MurJ n=1 Tax=Bacillus sp. FJAT-29790 TaxID=1895002 RepID=UPI001C236F48|nr:murein biosynthesis integral membrane protein MurJ [Bacillus sp. FJAT-29790]MBU8881102.1 murein biosynthesis integral membrane protein MurJ [Bacillus sp. FJAT-29790]
MSKLKIASILFLLSTFFLKFSSMIRDIVISGLYGDSYMADAYFAAMTIPNAIVLFMLTGMKDAFLPSYYKYDRLGKGFSHLTNIVKGTFWISAGISVIGAAASPWMVKILYPEFAHFEQGIQIAAWTAAIYFLSIALVGVNAVYEGYFDSQRKFSFSTFSQTIVVLTTILFALIFHKSLSIYAVPLGYLAGTFLSFLVKLFYMTPPKLLAWRQRMDMLEIRQFYWIFIPVGLTIAVGQINLTVNMLYASRLGEGVVSNLNYAFRLVNIPQAIFGVTIATIIYPILAKAKSEGDSGLFKQGMERGLSFMFLFLAPTVIGMMMLMESIVRLTYERGAFTESATALTSEYALFYIGSVLFYSIQAVVAKGFYTLEKGHYMMRVGMLSVVINIFSNYILAKLMGPAGLALSTSIVGFIYSAITFTTLYKISGGFNLKYIGKEYAKIIAAAVLMYAGLTGLGIMVTPEKWGDIPYLAIMIAAGALLYFAGLYLLRAASLFQLLSRGGKEKSSKTGD